MLTATHCSSQRCWAQGRGKHVACCCTSTICSACIRFGGTSQFTQQLGIALLVCRLEVEVLVEGDSSAALNCLSVRAQLYRCNAAGEVDPAGQAVPPACEMCWLKPLAVVRTAAAPQDQQRLCRCLPSLIQQPASSVCCSPPTHATLMQTRLQRWWRKPAAACGPLGRQQTRAGDGRGRMSLRERGRRWAVICGEAAFYSGIVSATHLRG